MFSKCIACLFLLIILAVHSPSEAQCIQNTEENSAIILSDAQKTSDSPKWRLVYVEGGPYIDFPYILKATVDGMYTLGLIDRPYPYNVTNEKSTKEIWTWLAKNAGGNYVEFVEDGFYSANWDNQKRANNKKALLDRFAIKNDVDIVLAFGTTAGRDMATNEHSVPTFSMSVTDAVQAGIIASAEDSGLDHVHGQVELGRYKRQLTLFHDIFKFKKLGVPVPDTAEGEAAIAFTEILETAKALQFEIIPCTLDFQSEGDVAYSHLQQCIDDLAPSVDAMYMTINQGMHWDKMPKLLEPIIKEEIPSFSQSGLVETKLGVLMSISQNSFKGKGIYSANALKQLMEGTRPRDISQIFESTLGLALNLEMARLIGWTPPFEVLAAVDAVYQKMYSAEELQ